MSASNGYANSGADVQYVIGFTAFSGNVIIEWMYLLQYL